MSYDEETLKIRGQAQHYYELGRYEQALPKIDQLLAINPYDNDVLFMRAGALSSFERYDEAIDCCRQALANGYSAVDGNYILGNVLMETGRYIETEECFLEALRINPERADILADYGELMLKTGHNKKAKALIEQALSIDPNDETVLLVHFYYRLAMHNRTAQAEALKRYMQTADSDVSKLALIGLMEYNNGNSKAARESFRQVYLLDPANKDILSLLEDLEKEGSIFYWPQRVIKKVGGPAVFWIGIIVLFFGLRALGFPKAAFITAVIYFIFCVYTWIMPFIYKGIKKIRG